jgi:hypothetical protein
MRFRIFHKCATWAGILITLLAALLLLMVVYGLKLTSQVEADRLNTIVSLLREIGEKISRGTSPFPLEVAKSPISQKLEGMRPELKSNSR